jgi:hypothetical protein
MLNVVMLDCYGAKGYDCVFATGRHFCLVIKACVFPNGNLTLTANIRQGWLSVINILAYHAKA